MKFPKDTTGVVILPSQISGLGIIRSLGRRGIPVVTIDTSRWIYSSFSRYCFRHLTLPNASFADESTVQYLVQVGRELPTKYVLYPTSDQALLLVSRYRSELLPYFRMMLPEHSLLEQLVNKQGMYQLALQHGLPTPKTCFPEDENC